MTLTQLQAVVKEGGMPRFVAGQIAKWLYDKRVTSFEEMNNISLKNKEWLSTYYTVGRTAPSAALKSKDATGRRWNPSISRTMTGPLSVSPPRQDAV